MHSSECKFYLLNKIYAFFLWKKMKKKLKREDGGVSMHVWGSQNPPSTHAYRERKTLSFHNFWALLMEKKLKPSWRTWQCV
jgi:hypothetical protein